MIDDRGFNHARRDGVGYMQAEEQERDKIEKGRPDYRVLRTQQSVLCRSTVA